MNKYYLLELIPENDRIQKIILYKVEFTTPYCISNILIKDVKKLNKVYFALTNNVDYLYDFFNVENVDELLEKCNLFYNKGNFLTGYVVHHLSGDNNFYIDLSSKKFDKYYSYDISGNLKNKNILEFSMFFVYNYESNKEIVITRLNPHNVLSSNKNNKKYIETIIENNYLLYTTHEFSISKFKHFNSFRDLALECIKLDKEWVNSKSFKIKYIYFDKRVSNTMLNEYYDILTDVAKGIEL